MSNGYIFTSESVSEGHPDKVADQISDAVLDAMLAQDKRARVACETLVKTGVAIVAGEVTTNAWVDLEKIVRGVITDIGYTSSNVGFDGNTCAVLNIIGKQSADIAQGVDRKNPEEQGAGPPGSRASPSPGLERVDVGDAQLPRGHPGEGVGALFILEDAAAGYKPRALGRAVGAQAQQHLTAVAHQHQIHRHQGQRPDQLNEAFFVFHGVFPALGRRRGAAPGA